MKYTYSKHILQRMIERNISAQEIELLLSNQVDIVSIPSKNDPDVKLILGIVFHKNIALIINKNTNKLITVRNMHKDEKDFFRSIKNEKK